MQNQNKVCSFCNKEIDMTRKKYFRSKATGTIICEDCVDKCSEKLQKSAKEKSRHMFNKMLPKELKAELDKYIVGQEEAKTSMAVAVYNHYKRIDLMSDVNIDKSNILMLGPTGSGKTLIAQTIAKIIDVPFTIVDCTSLTEAGYIGDDVESVISKLLIAADGNIESAERGIVFLDEIDKLAKSSLGSNLTKDPSGEGVQQALLKIIEGATIQVPLKNNRCYPGQESVQVNTKNILFICGGAFPNIKDIIDERISVKTSIGFGAVVEKNNIEDNMKQVSAEDLMKFGFIPEFMGRLPVIVTLNKLTESELVDILTKPKDCIINQYKAMFKYDGVELEFSDEVLVEIAQTAIKNNTGARGLRSIIEKILKETMYSLPSEENIKKCIVDKGGEISIIRYDAAKYAY